MGQLAGVRSTKQVEDLLISPSQTGAGQKATQMKEEAEKSCLFPSGAGRKTTQTGKSGEIRCLYRWQEAQKATKINEKGKP